MDKTHITASLANFACGLRFEKLPPKVLSKTKQLILDCIGNQIGAYGEEPAQMLYEVLGVETTPGESTVVGYGTKTSALLAGCMNGMLAHLLDMDDAHRDSLTKTGSAITPALLAVAEARQCNGKRVLEGAVAGYEVMIRLGLALNPGHRRRGFHSTATLGAFGAAAAVGRLLQLSEDRMVDALGIAGTQSAGLTAFINNPSMTKPFNVAKGVHSGILAALLAARGFRGPPDVIEGTEGFARGYSDKWDWSPVESGLGERYRLLESGFKPHAACRYAHGPIDAAITLMREHAFRAEELESVDVYLSELANRQSDFHDPGTIASAQGSTPFVIAASLAAATDTLTVSDVKRAFHDEHVRALHRTVKLHVDTQMDYMGRGCRLIVHLRDGRQFEKSVELPRGEPENPMSDQEIENKFMRQASAALGKEKAGAIRDITGRLEDQATVKDVMRLTAAGAASDREAA